LEKEGMGMGLAVRTFTMEVEENGFRERKSATNARFSVSTLIFWWGNFFVNFNVHDDQNDSDLWMFIMNIEKSLS